MLVLQVLSLTVPFIFVIIITLIKSDEKRKQNQFKADLYFKTLEKGQPSPVDLAEIFKEPQKLRSPLSVGTILLFVGAGISLTFWLMSVIFTFIGQNGVSNAVLSITPVGIIPFVVGIAYVIIHFIEKKKDGIEDAK